MLTEVNNFRKDKFNMRKRRRFRRGECMQADGQVEMVCPRGRRLGPKEEGHLSDLCIGQKAIVKGVHNDNLALRRRLLDMGITNGVTVEVKKIAPMGDPVAVKLRGYELCLRRQDLKNIDIEVLE